MSLPADATLAALPLDQLQATLNALTGQEVRAIAQDTARHPKVRRTARTVLQAHGRRAGGPTAIPPHMGDDGDDLDVLGEDDIEEDDAELESMGATEDEDSDEFGGPRQRYQKLARVVTRRMQKGRGDTPRTRKQVARMTKVWNRLNKRNAARRTAGLISPTDVLRAAERGTPAVTIAPPPAVVQTRPRIQPRTAQYHPRVYASPVYTAQQQAQTQAQVQAGGPYDVNTPPHRRRGYRGIMGGGRLLGLLRSFQTIDLQRMAGQRRPQPVLRAVHRVLRERGVLQAPQQQPWAYRQPPPRATYVPTAPGSTFVSRGRRYGAEFDFGGEVVVTPNGDGYTAVPWLSTSLKSHPIAFGLMALGVFGAGVAMSDRVKDRISTMY